MTNLIKKFTEGLKGSSQNNCCGTEIQDLKNEQDQQATDSCCGTTGSSDSCCGTGNNASSCCN